MDPTKPVVADKGDDDRSGRIARRVLLANVGAAAAGSLVVAGLALTGRGAAAYQAPAAPGHVHSGASTAPLLAPAKSAAPAATDHDAVHQTVTAAFPAKTQGQGLQELPSRVVDGVREFDLTCGNVRWEVTPGQLVDA